MVIDDNWTHFTGFKKKGRKGLNMASACFGDK